jgi:hypothetical protein
MLLRLIIKTLLVLCVLPALGLLAFHGGVGGAILAVILVAVAGAFTKFVLLPWLVSFGLISVGVGGLLGGRLGAFLVYFAISAGISAIALWLSSCIMSSVVLVGFWPTLGAGAMLSLVSTLFPDK